MDTWWSLDDAAGRSAALVAAWRCEREGIELILEADASVGGRSERGRQKLLEFYAPKAMMEG